MRLRDSIRHAGMVRPDRIVGNDLAVRVCDVEVCANG